MKQGLAHYLYPAFITVYRKQPRVCELLECNLCSKQTVPFPLLILLICNKGGCATGHMADTIQVLEKAGLECIADGLSLSFVDLVILACSPEHKQFLDIFNRLYLAVVRAKSYCKCRLVHVPH